MAALRQIGIAHVAYASENNGAINVVRDVGEWGSGHEGPGNKFASNSFWGRMQPHLFAGIETNDEKALYGGPNADSMVKRLEQVHALYKRPIWITEFAVGDWEAKSPEENRHKPEKIADFVAKLRPKLETMDIVERYCWFHGGVSGNALGTSSLFNADGPLTVVGEAYRAVG